MATITNQAQTTSSYSLPDGSQHSLTAQSNTVTTENMTTAFLRTRLFAVEYCLPKEEVEYTTVITNSSNLTFGDITFEEEIVGGSFKPESITIAGVEYKDLTLPQFTLPNPLTANEKLAIKYVVITDTNPQEENLTISSVISFFINDEDLYTDTRASSSIPIVNNQLSIEKNASQDFVFENDKLSYTNIIKNNGEIQNTNVTFFDTIPDGTTFVDGSVEIDGQLQADMNPENGILLGDIDPAGEKTVKFDVTINKS